MNTDQVPKAALREHYERVAKHTTLATPVRQFRVASLRSAIQSRIGQGQVALDLGCGPGLNFDPYIAKCPEIVFNLADDYGTDWAVHDSVFGVAASHGLVPGSHKGSSAVFLTANLGREFLADTMTVMDVVSIICDLLEGQNTPVLGGKSILR